MNPFSFHLVDLTHELTSQIPTWAGKCGFEHSLAQDYDLRAEYVFRTHKIFMEEGIGTHLDAPAHCNPQGKCISEMPLQDFLAPCVVIDISAKAHAKYSLLPQDINDFEKQYGEIQKGSFVIIYTAWDRFWNDPLRYHNNHIFPSVSVSAAELLLSRDLVGLGIDTLSPDCPEEGFPVHKLLLNANRYIVENIANAGCLPPKGSHSLALPLKIKDGTESPIRLVGLITTPS